MGLTCVIPNGAEAPGNVFPSSCVPMNVLTASSASPPEAEATAGLTPVAATASVSAPTRTLLFTELPPANDVIPSTPSATPDEPVKRAVNTCLVPDSGSPGDGERGDPDGSGVPGPAGLDRQLRDAGTRA